MKSLAAFLSSRETLTFAALLTLAVALSAVLPNMAFANGLVSQDDCFSIIGNCDGDLRSAVQTILNYFLGFLGFIATIMLIYAGVLMVSSGGNEDSFTKAKTIILYAVGGIVIVLLSFAIVNTVLGAASGGGVTG